MAYINGRLPAEALSAIEDGLRLEHRAAAAWLLCRVAIREETGIDPDVTNPDGAYRDYAGQVRQKALAVADGEPRRAAAPGYSSHGLGLSVDIYNIGRFNLAQLERIMRRFGFIRNIPFETWHFTHNAEIYTAPASLGGSLIVTAIIDRSTRMETVRRKATGDVFNIWPEGIKHLNTDAQWRISAAVQYQNDLFHDLTDPEFASLIDAYAIPHGQVYGLSKDVPFGHVWSATQALRTAIAAIAPAGPVPDLSAIMSKLDEINANIDDQPVSFKITPS